MLTNNSVSHTTILLTRISLWAALAVSSEIVQIGLPDCQREPNESRWRGHEVISNWEASILNTAARREIKVDLCQRKCWKGSGLKWYLRITVNWPLHITCLCKKQLSLWSTWSQHRNHRWFCEMQADYTLPFLHSLMMNAFYISRSLLTRTALPLFSLAWKSYLHQGKLYKKDSKAMNPK